MGTPGAIVAGATLLHAPESMIEVTRDHPGYGVIFPRQSVERFFNDGERAHGVFSILLLRSLRAHQVWALDSLSRWDCVNARTRRFGSCVLVGLGVGVEAGVSLIVRDLLWPFVVFGFFLLLPNR